jgi:hypothetical protein
MRALSGGFAMEAITQGLDRKYSEWLHARMRELLRELESPAVLDTPAANKHTVKPLNGREQDALTELKFSCEIDRS